MKTSYILMVATLMVAAISCKETDLEQENNDRLAIESTNITLTEGETASVKLSYSKFDRGVYVEQEYDFTVNQHHLRFTSSDESVAVVSDEGMIQAVGIGAAKITATADVKVDGYVNVTVDATEEIDYKFTGDIANTKLTSNNIVLPLGISHAVMQGFDMDRHGNIYISWEEDDGMHVRKFVGGKPVGEDMLLPTCGHGDCFCVEQDKNECYFWTVGSLGEPNGGFSGGLATDSAVRLTCRFKFEPGTVKYPEDAEECYYYNANGCRECEIDQEHDIVALWGYNGSDLCKIYKLSDLKKASKITKKVTRKFNNGKEVSVYDLNSLTPVGSFNFQRKVICGTRVVDGETQLHAIQGFTVYDGKVYFLAGYKNDPAATISVLDFSGKILQERTPVGLSADKDKLVSLNLSSNGTFEPEGMHIRKGVMYLGFVGDYTTAGAKKHSCILKIE
jgi:hypothetical protein